MSGSLPHIPFGFNCILDIAFWCGLLCRLQPIETLDSTPPRRPKRRSVTGSASASPGHVFARERQEHIARSVEEHGRVLVTDLAAQFGVSAVTIRKDLLALEGEHRLHRTHGGAIARDRSRPELAFEIRERLQPNEKFQIGAAGAALVEDGDSIVMDASTTALSVARQLKARGGWSQMTVITNGLRVASELAGHPGITVLMLGGRVRWEALSVVGQLGDGLFSRINVQKAFLGAAGFTLESGMADATEEEAQIKRAMVLAAREVIAIVDHTKWERTAFATFCETDQIGLVITDERAPDSMVRDLATRGVEVQFASTDVRGQPDAVRQTDAEGSPR
jgi:DeoR family transcriptional regulator of aga operon/DeoR family fructose operon transcriptional repressor